jgi:hypothetical protein
MKHVFSLLGFLLMSININANVNEMSDSTGLPGDHFSLEGALELFQKSDSPESYEKAINTEKSSINNLDLNGDGETDYIKVITKKDGDIHLIILQVPISDNEDQDIAVIEIEKKGNDNAILQIIGDEDIYGDEVIVEPFDGEDEADQRRGPSNYYSTPTIVVNVWGWPCVRFVYAVGYRPWVSPWRYRTYPTWWRPWRPLGWAVWHPLRTRHFHHAHVRVVHTHRVVTAHNIYKPSRASSTTVRTRHAGAHANYKVSHTKTKVIGPKGNTTTKRSTTVKGPKGNSATKKSTTVKGSQGNVKSQKTSVKKSRGN